MWPDSVQDLFCLLFHLPSSCLSMVARMPFCLSLADTTCSEVMIFSLPFLFIIPCRTLSHSDYSYRYCPLSSCVYLQLAGWMCMRLQRKRLDLFNIT